MWMWLVNGDDGKIKVEEARIGWYRCSFGEYRGLDLVDDIPPYLSDEESSIGRAGCMYMVGRVINKNQSHLGPDKPLAISCLGSGLPSYVFQLCLRTWHTPIHKMGSPNVQLEKFLLDGAYLAPTDLSYRGWERADLLQTVMVQDRVYCTVQYIYV